MKGERGFSEYLAYSHMAAPGVVALKNGSFLMGYRYKGPDFESATKIEVEHLAAEPFDHPARVGLGVGQKARAGVHNHPLEQGLFPLLQQRGALGRERGGSAEQHEGRKGEG